MQDYVLVGNKHDEVPTYMVSSTTFELSDENLNNDMDTKNVPAPIGTLLVTPGYKSIKQRGNDGSWIVGFEEVSS